MPLSIGYGTKVTIVGGVPNLLGLGAIVGLAVGVADGGAVGVAVGVGGGTVGVAVGEGGGAVGVAVAVAIGVGLGVRAGTVAVAVGVGRGGGVTVALPVGVGTGGGETVGVGKVTAAVWRSMTSRDCGSVNVTSVPRPKMTRFVSISSPVDFFSN